MTAAVRSKQRQKREQENSPHGGFFPPFRAHRPLLVFLRVVRPAGVSPVPIFLALPFLSAVSAAGASVDAAGVSVGAAGVGVGAAVGEAPARRSSPT